MKHLLYLILLIAACTPTPKDVVNVDALPPVYPDYIDVTIPQNIAPLNFLLRIDNCEALEVRAGDLVVNTSGNEVVFDIDEWKELLARQHDITVTISARVNGTWKEYKPFSWHVVGDSIDPWLTYRLIEPDYEVWNHVEIRQRSTEDFDEAPLADYEHQENRCMNCHTFGAQRPDLSMLYVRGAGGGAILNQGGQLRKLDLKADSLISSSVYFGFSPSGRYIAFSTNLIIPAFHSQPRKRLEVYDSKSDVYVADLQEHRILRSPLLSQGTVFETFPTFSPDGKYIYYCAADSVLLPSEVTQLQYALVRIPFDETTGRFGTQVDTLAGQADSIQQKHSVCHPRISPDGRYLLYTVADYGTFPIWHPEADLRLLDLQTGAIDTLAIVNSQKSDTYHSWSSNSHWFVFASKRDDGLYGKPYFCYVDEEGRAHKPFCLPQRYPTYYDNTLKSFNAPELGRGRLPFGPDDVARAMKQEAEKFN
ncbi:MAG: hypothetical protein K5683_03625 [Prevotella sp.]|nr:hypothetical protein [Prevotella sp.]